MFFSKETTVKALAHAFPHTLRLLMDPGVSQVALRGVAGLLLLGIVSNQPSCQRQLSPNLLASPKLKNNKTYILSHKPADPLLGRLEVNGHCLKLSNCPL